LPPWPPPLQAAKHAAARARAAVAAPAAPLGAEVPRNNSHIHLAISPAIVTHQRHPPASPDDVTRHPCQVRDLMALSLKQPVRLAADAAAAAPKSLVQEVVRLKVRPLVGKGGRCAQQGLTGFGNPRDSLQRLPAARGSSLLRPAFTAHGGVCRLLRPAPATRQCRSVRPRLHPGPRAPVTVASIPH
jgi:hypothetical protein